MESGGGPGVNEGIGELTVIDKALPSYGLEMFRGEQVSN